MKRLILQAAVCLLLSLAVYLLRPVYLAYTLGVWLLIPAAGAVSAFAVVKSGINPYIAWIVPPTSQSIGAFIASAGYLPGFGYILLTIFLSVTGAAFADAYLKLKAGRRR